MHPTNCKPRRSALYLLALCAVPSCGPSADTVDCQSLKEFGVSAQYYKEVHGRFPPPVVLDESGRPMHSWRVLVLTFLEQNQFYGNYDFDAAWNDPANADLADGTRLVTNPKEPKPRPQNPTGIRIRFKAHRRELAAGDFTTDFLMVVRGDESLIPFEIVTRRNGEKVGGLKAPADDPDEQLLVQVKTSNVHWMEPKDIILAAPAPDWGIPLDSVKADTVSSVLISHGKVTCSGREATLKLLAERQAKVSAAAKNPK